MPENKNQSLTNQLGGNQATIRTHNEHLILDLIRKNGPISKSDAAKLTGLSNNATSVILRSLETDGLLVKGEPVRGKIGQPSIPMEINPSARHYIAFRIGRRSIELAAMNFSGEILSLKKLDVPYPTPSHVMDFFRHELLKVLKAAKLKKSDVSAMSIVMPFELWSWTEEFGAPAQEMLEWKAFDLKAAVKKILNCPISLENDGTAACRAELMFAKHSGKNDWIYFFVGTFIGGGVVLNGKLFSGSRGNAGGFGPMRVPKQQGKDRLVDHASLVVLERMLLDKGIQLRETADWQEYQPELDNWINRAAHSLAHAIVSSLSVIDFEAVVIDGLLPTYIKRQLTDEIGKQLSIIDIQGIEPPQIEPGQIGPMARLRGAAALQIEKAFPSWTVSKTIL